jgi:hypothetical protein
VHGPDVAGAIDAALATERGTQHHSPATSMPPARSVAAGRGVAP